MLAKERRLPVKTKIGKGAVFSTPFFTVRIGKNNERISRFAFIVNKAVDKRAVIRNKTKRRLRGFVEKEYNNIEPGYDFLFKAKKGLLEIKKEDLYETIVEIFKKEKLVK